MYRSVSFTLISYYFTTFEGQINVFLQRDDEIASTPPEFPVDPTKATSVRLLFEAVDEFNVVFECKLDSQAWTPCTSPYLETNLPQGLHVFSVRVPGNPISSTNWTVGKFCCWLTYLSSTHSLQTLKLPSCQSLCSQTRSLLQARPRTFYCQQMKRQASDAASTTSLFSFVMAMHHFTPTTLFKSTTSPQAATRSGYSPGTLLSMKDRLSSLNGLQVQNNLYSACLDLIFCCFRCMYCLWDVQGKQLRPRAGHMRLRRGSFP